MCKMELFNFLRCTGMYGIIFIASAVDVPVQCSYCIYKNEIMGIHTCMAYLAKAAQGPTKLHG